MSNVVYRGTERHPTSVWLLFDRHARSTTLTEVEALCAQLRRAGAADGQRLVWSVDHGPRLLAEVEETNDGRQ